VRRICFLLLLLSLVASCFAQADIDVSSRVTVLASLDARARATDRMRLVRELTQVISVLHVSPQQLPNIVVIFAGDDAARIDALPAGAKVTVAKISISDGQIYQVWITGSASDANAVQGLVWVVNNHFGLHLSAAQVADVRERVTKQIGATVSVSALAAGSH
jgi:hypothetical protein